LQYKGKPKNINLSKLNGIIQSEYGDDDHCGSDYEGKEFNYTKRRIEGCSGGKS